jgi:hypothetical protein
MVKLNDDYDAAFDAAIVSVGCGIVHGNVKKTSIVRPWSNTLEYHAL